MVYPESIQPINILKKVTDLEKWYLSPFKVLPLGPHTLIPAFLPLFKTIWKVLFRNRHQLPRHILLNLVCSLKSPPFQWQFQFQEKPEVAGSQIWAVGGLTDLSDVMLCQKSLHKSCRMGRHSVVMKLICSFGHCECDGHSTQGRTTASHCRLTSPTGEWLFMDAQ